MAVAAGEMRTPQAAVARLRAAAARNPKRPQVWRELADHLDVIGQRAAAADAYLKHVQHAIHDPALMAPARRCTPTEFPKPKRGLRQQLQPGADRCRRDPHVRRAGDAARSRRRRRASARTLSGTRAGIRRGAAQPRDRVASDQQADAGACRTRYAAARRRAKSRLPQSEGRGAVPRRRIRNRDRDLRRAAARISAAGARMAELRTCVENRRPYRARHRRVHKMHRDRSRLRRSVLEPREPEDVSVQRCADRHDAQCADARRSRRRTSSASRLRARQGAGRSARLRDFVPPLRERECAAAEARAVQRRRNLTALATRARNSTPPNSSTTRHGAGCADPSPDLHRRPAARGIDADRTDPRQPFAGRRHDGIAGDHVDHARAETCQPKSQRPITTRSRA